MQEEPVLSGIETVSQCGLTKAMQQCVNPMRRVSVNPPGHVQWLCLLAAVRRSSQEQAITTFRFWRSSLRPRTGIRKRANAAAPSQMWR
jgi:hypothetical protein